jgi:hypothetical protein
MPSVCTPASAVDVDSDILTWHPKSLWRTGNRGSLGVLGRVLGGWTLILGIASGGGDGRRPGVADDGRGGGLSVCVKDVTIKGFSTTGACTGGGGGGRVGDLGVIGGTSGSSFVWTEAETITR